MQNVRGKFIVIDGTDGSGKATQTNRLVKHLKEKGYKVRIADFPRYGKRSATMVEDYLNGEYGSADEVGAYRASIFFACDRYAASFELKKWLRAGEIVISNRYTSANMGHQAGKISDAKERDNYLDWLHDLEFNVFAIPKPDLTLLLYLDPKTGQQWVDKKDDRKYLNGKKRDIHEADIKHLSNAAEAYKYVAGKYNWPVINADQSIPRVHRDIWKIVSTIL
ncbi:MAG: dTMP kinase [Candidatus Dojkabacteria bacterium]